LQEYPEIFGGSSTLIVRQAVFFQTLNIYHTLCKYYWWIC